MGKAFRFSIGLVVLFGVAAIFLCSIKPHPSYLLLLSIFVPFISGGLALVSDRGAYISLGIALCVLPLFGAGTLNLFILGWVGGVYVLRTMFGVPYASIDLAGSREIVSWALFLFLLPLVCSAGVTISADFDSAVILAIFRSQGLAGLYGYLSSAEVTWFRALNSAAGSIVGVLLFFSVLSAANVRQNFQDLLLGLCVGSLLAIGFLIGQLTEAHAFFFSNMNPFWDYVGRYPATFTDPNAFGVMTMLIMPALLGCAVGRRGPVYAFLAVLIFCFSIWSGSRTMYLGLVIWGMLFLQYLVRHTQRRELTFALWIGAAFFSIFVFLLGYPAVNEQLQKAIPYPGAVRMLSTIHWGEAEGMFFSRRTYSKIAYATWQKSPLAGIGLERFFSEQQRVMKTLNIDLGQWRDNANNYYLQVLAEEGVLGLSLVFVSVSLLALALLSPQRKVLLDTDQIEPAAVERSFFVCRSLMLVMAITLVTGPHLNFPEVRYLVMLLLAVSASRPIVVRGSFLKVVRAISLSMALLFPPLFSVAVARGIDKTLSTGFYAAEESGAVHIAWTVDRARLFLCEPYPGAVHLRIRAGNPDISRRPLHVALFERDPRERGPLRLDRLQPVRIKLVNNDWIDVEVPVSAPFSPARQLIEIRVERLWSPRASQSGNDPRALGVMVELPDEMC